MLTIVGLGCSPEDLSRGAYNAVTSGAKVILRTGETPAAQAILSSGAPCATLDYIYESCRNFDTLNKKLAAAVAEEAEKGDVVYCVDGSVAEDVSAQILLRKKKDARVFCGVSKADAAFAAAKVSACDRTAVSAYSGGGARLRLPLAVYDVDCDLVATCSATRRTPFSCAAARRKKSSFTSSTARKHTTAPACSCWIRSRS